MARTWTLLATLSLSSNLTTSPFVQRALTNAAGTVLYFNAANNALGYRKIYKWDGAAVTDITGTSFHTSTSNPLRDICVFNDEIFAGFSDEAPASMDPGLIYKYSGSGTTWNLDYTLPDEAAGADGSIIRGSTASENWVFAMDCDDTYMAVVGQSQSLTGPGIMFMRTTGGTWTLAQMPGSVYPEPMPFLVGLSKGSRYGKLIGVNLPGASDYRTIERGSPTPWANLASSNIGDKRLIGYAGSKSFFTVNTGGSTWELKYSTDWGVNLTAAGGLTQTTASQKAVWAFLDAGSGIIMLAKKTDQAYTWDADTDTFVADGTVDPARSIYAYFVLNGQLCALCTNGNSNEAEVWTAGSICQASFYYGIEIPAFASDLPICGVEPGAVAISSSGLAVLGSNGRQGPAVVWGQYPFTDPWTDIGGIVPTGTSVTSVKFL